LRNGLAGTGVLFLFLAPFVLIFASTNSSRPAVLAAPASSNRGTVLGTEARRV